jgi:DNA-binding NtrC family response regulator
VADTTETAESVAPRDGKGAAEWALAVALDCEQLREPPARLSLAGVTDVDVGRGEEREFRRTARQLRVDLPDRSVSQLHARLRPSGENWIIEDAGSKNGTRVNGRRVDRAELCDGDVVECGRTFFVMRRAAGPIGDLFKPAGSTRMLQTISPALERELAILPKIARSRVPVLVRGDSGTGKEVVAQAVHALSGRKGAFTPVNCGAIPETLVESELFGSRRGAFSGAEDRAGLVRNAERGTLFLDEIAELPATSQAALLRVLQDGEVMPLGGDKSVVVDVRVVAATNRPMEDLVAAGSFRRDLYSRLRGYEMHLPPLRARIEDLGILCSHLLARIEPDGPTRTLSRSAARALLLHPWPFHVRELEQSLRAAAAIASGAEIDVDDLRLGKDISKESPAEPHGNERERLVALLQKHGGNLSAIARELETSRSQVSRLLARYGLDTAEYKPRP